MFVTVYLVLAFLLIVFFLLIVLKVQMTPLFIKDYLTTWLDLSDAINRIESFVADHYAVSKVTCS